MLTKDELKFRIVGGHHRFDAAAYLGLEDVPVTVIMDDSFDEDQERFQLVRMNMIRGKLDPQAFFDLYNSLAPAYSDEVLQDAFGFADEAEFRKLIDQTAKALPDKNLQKKFKEAAEEIKTIDGLSKLLNEMFTKYGDTLPFGYMVFDHGGQRSMWLRIEGKTMNALDLLGTLCIDQARTVDDVIGGILQLAAKGELKEHVDKVIGKTPAVELPAGLSVAPTKDNLAEDRRAMTKKAAGPSVIERLESLGPEVMDRIDSRMASGESPITVARWVQDDLQQLTDVKLETLKKALHRYLGGELRDKVMGRIAAAQRGASQATVLKRLNAMDELEEMVRYQRGRVDKLLMREEQLPGGILLKDTTNEIRLLKDMLVDLGRVQMETGLLPRAAKTIKGTVTGADGQIKEFAWTEEQEELFKEIEELESAAARET